MECRYKGDFDAVVVIWRTSIWGIEVFGLYIGARYKGDYGVCPFYWWPI